MALHRILQLDSIQLQAVFLMNYADALTMQDSINARHARMEKMRAEGKRDWSDYKKAISEGFGLWSHVPVSPEDEKILQKDFYDIFLKYGPMVDGLYNKSEFLIYDAIRILNRAASIDWTSLYHTGMYTPIFTKGVGETLFLDCRDQTEIPKTIARLMGGQL